MDDNGAIRSHKDLDVWKSAMSLAERLYKETSTFPRDEVYGMTAQIRRAGVSIPANIAEGYGRSQTGQFAQFIRISLGSAQELDTHVMLAGRFGFLSQSTADSLQGDCERVTKMLRGLLRSLEFKAAKGEARR